MSHGHMILLVLLVGLLAPWPELLGVSEVMSVPEKCTLPAETGKCRAAFPHYYYDTNEKACKEFTWGGCGGNKNNFVTEEDCIKECQDE